MVGGGDDAWKVDEDAEVVRAVREQVGESGGEEGIERRVEEVDWNRVLAEIPYSTRTADKIELRFKFISNPLLNIRYPWTSEEDMVLITVNKTNICNWTEIAKLLEGRTEYCIQKRWVYFTRTVEGSRVFAGYMAEIEKQLRSKLAEQQLPYLGTCLTEYQQTLYPLYS